MYKSSVFPLSTTLCICPFWGHFHISYPLGFIWYLVSFQTCYSVFIWFLRLCAVAQELEVFLYVTNVSFTQNCSKYIAHVPFFKHVANPILHIF